MLYALYLLAIIVLITADQFSKYIIVKNFVENNPITLIEGFFRINYVKNYGAGFSILQNQKIFLIVIGIFATIGFSYLLIKSTNKETLNRICYILIIGGTIGNLIDRISLNYVVDFLDFFIFTYDFPVFNLADSFLTIGCVLLIISILKESNHAKNWFISRWR